LFFHFFCFFVLHFCLLNCNVHDLHGWLDRSWAVWTPKLADELGLGWIQTGNYILLMRTCLSHMDAAVAQLVERVLGKDEVMGPSPISSSLEPGLSR
jgi:hypothetical protein